MPRRPKSYSDATRRPRPYAGVPRGFEFLGYDPRPPLDRILDITPVKKQPKFPAKKHRKDRVGADDPWDADLQSALFDINRAGMTGRFALHKHAFDQMRRRRIDRSDVRHGLRVARKIEDQVDRYRLYTYDPSGDDLVLVVVVQPDGEVEVKTVF